ncbi:MAG: CDGSH iron-sulfur domain-containing protein [Anaerolineae bacterium]|jgi:CDGSH-type Zn-finger protein|nr:CDGSH iron-sulfur domain-containing protein [Anaerolineae bacterium]
MSVEPIGKQEAWIEVEADGPYVVHGPIAFVRKVQVVSEHGEPLTWRKDVVIATGDTYELCRCGASTTWPFCDASHREISFDGTEAAETNTVEERRVEIPGGTGIVVYRDYSLCMESGFCGNRMGNVEEMTTSTDESTIRGQVMAMIERCPSGSFMYALRRGDVDIEPDLPCQVALTVEITSDGPIRGPLWVTGNIPIRRADGQPFQTRNRVTLCNCGKSKTKPLCDGTHRREPVFITD